MQKFTIAGISVAIDDGILKYKYIQNILRNFVEPQHKQSQPFLTVKIGKVVDFQSYEYSEIASKPDIENFFYRERNRFFRKMIKNETSVRSEFYRKENHTFEMIIDYEEDSAAYILAVMLYCVLRWGCSLAFVQRQTLGFHASTIIYQEKSLLFLGKSGTGKSTHSQLWINSIDSVELLNDDEPFVQIAENKVFTYGTPWSGSDKTACFKNKSVQTAAFVLLEQAPHNKIRKLNFYESLALLLGSSRFYHYNDEFFITKNYEIISEILKKVPVYHLECLPNFDAAHLVLDTLKNDNIL